MIEKAKEYALSHNKSLSRLIEAYLKSLVIQDYSTDNDEIKISPFVKSISSCQSIPPELDYKTNYMNHLVEKHK